ncbi:MAG: translin family protein [Thermoplasmata archaeon]|nr:translin family protein [Thermoplasmata archaeon]MCI4356216.1 translin family protein [Thermoplasmata archaeon]
MRAIERHLAKREERRRELHERARVLRRLSQQTMTRLHAGSARASEAKEVRRELRRLSADLPTSYPGDEGLAEDALQEGVEALLLIAVMAGTDFPTPDELGVPPESYLLGMGDVVGEVRRLVLAELTRGEVARAGELLAVMESIYRTLLGFETTRAIVSLKPKQDTARALVERTRGEVTMARLLHRAGVHVASPEPSS